MQGQGRRHELFTKHKGFICIYLHLSLHFPSWHLPLASAPVLGVF